MRQVNMFTKSSCYILILSAITVLNEFIQLIPTHATKLEGIILFIGPSLFAVIGLILAIAGVIKQKSRLGIIMIIFNFILLFWPLIYWHVGTYVFGV